MEYPSELTAQIEKMRAEIGTEYEPIVDLAMSFGRFAAAYGATDEESFAVYNDTMKYFKGGMPLPTIVSRTLGEVPATRALMSQKIRVKVREVEIPAPQKIRVKVKDVTPEPQTIRVKVKEYEA